MVPHGWLKTPFRFRHGTATSFARLAHNPYDPATAEIRLDLIVSPAHPADHPVRCRTSCRCPGPHQGHGRCSRIDVAVSALGDLTGLTSGTLLVTSLLAAYGEVCAVAQGAVAATSGSRGVPTSARQRRDGGPRHSIPSGQGQRLRLGLRTPDLATARRNASRSIIC
jgi:hypothetical protein